MVSDPIVELAGVSKVYGGFTALQRTDLAIAEGEFVTLLGPSGCGKTTTLRLIGGFEEASSGRVRIAGRDMTASPPYHRPVNTVFQDYALFPHMSVADNVGYGLDVRSGRVGRDERARRVGEALDMVGLASMARRRPAELSGGQRQRVAMARALVRRPRVLLLDEPLSALDVKLREGMQGELKRLHRDLGITFLMVTHDQNEALALSDRIVVMNRGRIAQIGTPNALYDAPATAHVADFIGSANLLAAEPAGSEGTARIFRLANGTLIRSTRATPEGGAPGARVMLGLRPERLLPADPGTINAIECTVRESLFRGERQRLELGLDGIAPPLIAELPRVALPGGDALAPGVRAWFAIGADDVLVLADEGAE